MRDPIHDLRAYAAHLESEVPAERARARAMAAMRAPSKSPRRAVVALATVGFMSISNVALATAADPAAPGDALYGVDRAYERIGASLGIGGDHRFERLTEAAVVLAAGDAATALSLVQESLSGLLDDPETARAMLAQLENGADVSLLQSQVRLMVEIARNSAETAGDDALVGAANGAPGQDIAEIARKIRESVDLPGQAGQDYPGENGGPPSTTPAGSAPGGPPSTTPAGSAPGGPPSTTPNVTPPGGPPPITTPGATAPGGPPSTGDDASPSDSRPSKNTEKTSPTTGKP
ncbi:MAG: hypothetical protein OEX04_09930 [Acidimicrobiia bacterium]|nr:hypothetical protein [Acidimicrobiia bacterium]